MDPMKTSPILVRNRTSVLVNFHTVLTAAVHTRRKEAPGLGRNSVTCLDFTFVQIEISD